MKLLLFIFILSCKNIQLNTSSNDISSNPNSPAIKYAEQEWTLVPANSGGMGLPAFYVMKYEAKAFSDLNSNGQIDIGEVDATGLSIATATHIPVSIADNQPWRNIDADDATSECESLGSGYRLISNAEWMAIARNIEVQDANWTGGSVGSGCIFRGNSGDTTCGYNSATDPDSGSSRNARARHVLSNGQEIYDIAGNLYEWVDWDRNTPGFQLAPTSCTASWTELPSVSCVALGDSDFNSVNGTYLTAQGIGQFYGGTGGAAFRSGRWSSNTYAGIYTLFLSQVRTYTSPNDGIRCVFSLE